MFSRVFACCKALPVAARPLFVRAMSLAGKTVVFTGTLSVTRAVAALQAKGAGAKVTASVSSSTDILVAGADAIITAKIAGAKAKGVDIWDEKKFKEVISGAKAGKAAGRGAAGREATRVAQQADGHPNGVALRKVKTAEPVENIPNGASVSLLKADGEWCFVEHAGRKGWVKTRNLKDPGKRAPPDGAGGGPAKVAKAKLGPPSKAEVKILLGELGLNATQIMKEIDFDDKELDRERFDAVRKQTHKYKKHLRHSMVMELKDSKSDPTGPCTKFGGMPWLRKGDEWPTCEACESNMRFYAQIHFKDLDGKSVHAACKNDGLLQLWSCGDDCDTYEAFSGATSVRIVPSKDFGKGEKIEKPDDVELCPVQLVKQWVKRPELPGQEELGDEMGDEAEADDIDWLMELISSANPNQGVKVGGWPGWCQGVEYPECPECGERMTNVLFQLEADIIEGEGLGDCGTAHITQCKKHKSKLAYAWACC